MAFSIEIIEFIGVQNLLHTDLISLATAAGGTESSAPGFMEFIPLMVIIWAVMYFTKSISWGITIPIAVIAGLVLVRIFIISHDCGHGSFLKSKRANNFWGFVSGLFVFTP